MKRLVSFIVAVVMFSGVLTPALASDLMYEGPADWTSFDKFMAQKENDDRTLGMSYMISGLVATVAGVAGYYNSDDPFSRGLYVVSQSVGVAAMGYGASYYYIGNEYTSFYRAVDGSRLTPLQKTEILKRFLDNEKKESERRRWIKVVTHALIAGLNFYSASREQDRNVKGVLNFLGAINAAMAVTYSFQF